MPSTTLRRATVAYAEHVETQAGIDVGSMWDRFLNEFLNEYATQSRAGQSGARLDARMQEFMDALSNKPLEQAAREGAAVAYNEGRALAGVQAYAAGRAEYAVRSEFLDIRTCEACATLDGSVVQIGTSDYEALKPPSRCLGGERCRGIYVVLGKGVTA